MKGVTTAHQETSMRIIISGLLRVGHTSIRMKALMEIIIQVNREAKLLRIDELRYMLETVFSDVVEDIDMNWETELALRMVQRQKEVTWAAER